MNDDLMEQLLHEGESASLDYKRDQYPFAGATDDDKSELLKDVLAFANGWRHAEAYILIGVDEVTGGRSVVAGVSGHIPENDLQQFVNSKTNRTVTFSYRAYPFEGKQVGVVTIPQQDRPIYLTKNYGKLQKHVVYYRQGTTTAIATPDDIAKMGKNQTVVDQEPSLTVLFADINQELSLSDRVAWAVEYCQVPESKQIPKLTDKPNYISNPLSGRRISIPSMSELDPYYQLNERYYRQLAEYEYCKRLFRKTRFVVSNTGNTPASDVRLELTVPKNQSVVIMSPSKFPEIPKRRVDRFTAEALQNVQFRSPIRRAGKVDIDENDHRFRVIMDCGDLQPGRQVWSDKFYIGVGTSSEVELVGHLLSANLAGPMVFKLVIEATVAQSEMTVSELLSLSDPVDDDE